MKPTDEQYRQTAHKRFHVDGELEIDDDAKISRGAEGLGAYVQAWVWVYDSEIKEELTTGHGLGPDEVRDLEESNE